MLAPGTAFAPLNLQAQVSEGLCTGLLSVD